MNKYNHFLAPFILLFVLFNQSNTIIEIIIFSVVFGALLDQNQRIGRHLGKPVHHLRTWIEEPLGILFIGFPLGLLLSLIDGNYFFMVVIPYATHIILDYLTIHEVCPLAPLSSKSIEIGFFKNSPPDIWYTGNEKGISENYFLSLNVIIVIVLLFLLI